MRDSFYNLVIGAWKSTAGVRVRFFAFITLFVIAYTVDLLVPWAIGWTLGVFVKEGFTPHAYDQALLGLGAYVGFRLLHTLCHHLARYLQLTVAFSARMETLTGIFANLLAFPLSWHVNHHSGESLSRLHRSAGAVDQTIGVFVWQIVEGAVKVIFASVAIFALDFWVAVNVLTMGLLTILLMVLFNKRLTSYIRRNNAFYDRLNRICVDYLYNVVTVKSLGLESRAQEYLEKVRPEGQKLSKRIAAFGELKWGSVGVGYCLVMGSSLWIYFNGHRGFEGAFDVAQVYVLLNYLDRIFQAIGSFTGYYSGIIEASTAYEDATSILKESPGRLSWVPSTAPKLTWNTLTLRDLEFRYVKADVQGIRAKDLTIRAGDKIALVGPSGGGKSTLLKVFGGMLIPDTFDAVTDGTRRVDIGEINRVSLMLPQEPEIFSETVRYNLTMGESYSDEDLRFFISLCKVQDVIEKIKGGWDADLAEKGLNLSVGERQRFAMARGLLRASDRSILLLDEPTSSLDPMTEKQIFHGILQRFADRTVITACHRLALVPLFDKIIYIRRGVIEEMGSFKDLLDKRGLFYAAWDDYERKVASPDPS